MSKRKNIKNLKKQKEFKCEIYCRFGTKEQLGELKDNNSKVSVKK